MIRRNPIAVLISIVTLGGPAAVAQSFDLSWNTIDGGGDTSTGGAFSMSGTIGQPDAQVCTGGSFELAGGFWPAFGSAPAPCIGDLDGNQQVNLNDLATLLAHFGVQSGATLADGDLTGDGAVGLNDLSILLSHFGVICS